jgi:hypothetical protein
MKQSGDRDVSRISAICCSTGAAFWRWARSAAQGGTLFILRAIRWFAKDEPPVMIAVALAVAFSGGYISYKTLQISRSANKLVEQQNAIMDESEQPIFTFHTTSASQINIS